VLIAEAVFLFWSGHTDTQTHKITDATDHRTHTSATSAWAISMFSLVVRAGKITRLNQTYFCQYDILHVDVVVSSITRILLPIRNLHAVFAVLRYVPMSGAEMFAFSRSRQATETHKRQTDRHTHTHTHTYTEVSCCVRTAVDSRNRKLECVKRA